MEIGFSVNNSVSSVSTVKNTASTRVVFMNELHKYYVCKPSPNFNISRKVPIGNYKCFFS